MAPPLHVTQQYCLASMATWLPSTGVSHHSLLPHIPLIRLSTVNSSPRPGTAPQSLNSSSQPLCLLGDQCPVWGMQGCSKVCLILIPFRLPQISCFILSLKCFSSDSDSCPQCGDQIPALVSPPAEGRSSPINTPVFNPQFLRPTEFCMVLYILFLWSSTPVCSQLVFCIHFCV